MGLKYLWDTNIAIYFLQNAFPLDASKYIDTILKESAPLISVITEIELMSWTKSTAETTTAIQNFINGSEVLELDRLIKIRTAELRRNYKTKLPDAIIGATALVHGLKLVTHNSKDFSKIEGFIIIDPWDI